MCFKFSNASIFFSGGSYIRLLTEAFKHVTVTFAPRWADYHRLRWEGTMDRVLKTQARDVREQLRRILESDGFNASARNRRFLEYVVEETLAGRADRIKAYSVATSVFGRGPDFNPDLDSIVRIEAGRLRRALDHYYLTAGGKTGSGLRFRKGLMCPHLGRLRFNPANPAATLLSAVNHPTFLPKIAGLAIFVMPFEEEGDQSAFPNFTRGFTRLLIVGLMRFTGLTVFGSGPILACGNVGQTEKARDRLRRRFHPERRDDDFCNSFQCRSAARPRHGMADASGRRASSGPLPRPRSSAPGTRSQAASCGPSPEPYGVVGQQSAAGNDSSQPASLNVCQSVDSAEMFAVTTLDRG